MNVPWLVLGESTLCLSTVVYFHRMVVRLLTTTPTTARLLFSINTTNVAMGRRPKSKKAKAARDARVTQDFFSQVPESSMPAATKSSSATDRSALLPTSSTPTFDEESPGATLPNQFYNVVSSVCIAHLKSTLPTDTFVAPACPNRQILVRHSQLEERTNPRRNHQLV